MFRRLIALCAAGIILLSAFMALAETTETETDADTETVVVTDTETGDYEDDSLTEEEASEISGTIEDADEDVSLIDGLEPLYTTKVKFLTSSGYTVTIRAEQDTDAKALGYANKGDVVTIYAVYPAFVLIEFEGVVGYILRTCIDEDVTVLDPVNTAPYAVCQMQYVATTTEKVNIYTEPDTSSEINDIQVGAGNTIAILEFVDGFAKVIYWRTYGYIDASLLTDLVVVSTTDEPMSDSTPIAAFSSFFAYDTGSELNDGRVNNIVRSCELMTRVMQPGESLNFNEQIGPYKKSNGYFLAPVLIDGETVPGYGGGTCQSSSTLYNTVRQLPGITVTYRRAHGPACARYLPMHQDAAVGSDELNFIFQNDYDFPISIVAESTGEGVITIQIFKVTD